MINKKYKVSKKELIEMGESLCRSADKYFKDNYIKSFLKNSNEIEGVFDNKSLMQAIEAFNYLLRFKSLDGDKICKAHEMLMKDLLEPKHLGKIRKVPVFVGKRKCSAHFLDSRLMAVIDMKVNTPLDILGKHLLFEEVHPFIDGNGRIGRMIYMWECFKYNIFPIIFSKAWVNGYYSLFDELKIPVKNDKLKEA